MSPRQEFDLVALGRIAVDLYGEQIGTSVEETTSFKRYVGGSSANLSVGCARLGLTVALMSRVGDDPMGRYARHLLGREGVDHSRVSVDPNRRTGLAFLGMARADAITLDYYRENVADLAAEVSEADAALFTGKGAFAITGTHFSSTGSAAAAQTACALAHKVGRSVVIDVDLRAGLWEQHPAGIAGTVAAIREAAAIATLVVGNEDEFRVLSGEQNLIDALRALRAVSPAIFILKRGPTGATAFAGAIPADLDGGETQPGFPVPVMNVVGAGDAFLAGFLAHWLKGGSVSEALAWGNAAGALVVSRHACSDAMPFPSEIAAMFRYPEAPIEEIMEEAAVLQSLGRQRPAKANLTALAFDHRVPFRALLARTGRTVDDARHFKSLIARAARDVAEAKTLTNPGVFVDREFAASAMDTFTESGWWVARPVEITGSRPLRFECKGSLEADIRTWNPGHVAKCLVWYHPDDPVALKDEQIATLKRLQLACQAQDQAWMLEVILPLDMPRSEAQLLDALAELYAAGLDPDWLKLEGLSSAERWAQLEAFLQVHARRCHGVIMLGLSQPIDQLRAPLQLAAQQAVCQGFAIGRTVFMQSAEAWFGGTIEDEQAVDQMKRRFSELVDIWTTSARSPARVD